MTSIKPSLTVLASVFLAAACTGSAWLPSVDAPVDAPVELPEPGSVVPDAGSSVSEGDAGVPQVPGGNPDGAVFVDAGQSPLLFVSRPVLPRGSIYWDGVKGVPGVGAATRFKPATPGKLLVREPSGQVRSLIDGAAPTAASLNLVDVNAPDVDYDGQRVVFAGLVSGQFRAPPVNQVTGDANGWRIFTINADGTGLRQLTRSDIQETGTQFGFGGTWGYDDTDPIWLPDGRIAFASSRWFIFGQYSGVRSTNLYVMNADGSGLRRITSERNGADRPQVDPITGKIVYSRWWRNHRFPVNSMATITDPAGGYVQKDGLTAERSVNETMFRNAWHLASIRPDGTGLTMFNTRFRSDDATHVYGGSFAPGGDFLGNYFPLGNMTEVTGCGGIRRYLRGANGFTAVNGETQNTLNYANVNPTSYGCNVGVYTMDAAPLPDGRVVFSRAPDVGQDYGLWIMDADGSNAAPLFDLPGTVESRAKALAVRARPPVLADTVSTTPSVLPPTSDPATFRKDGTFEFLALNVYANGPVDSDIVHAVPVGSAKRIRFFLDHQRTTPGSFPNLDWPILLGDVAISPAGYVEDKAAPASVPLFEQLRDGNNQVPVAGGRYGNPRDGHAHVAGMNFGRAGQKARCVGCHSGHTLIDVPADDAEAAFSNLAPGATVTASTTRSTGIERGVVDRRVLRGRATDYWQSAAGQVTGQWVQLEFPVPVSVRRVVLYNPRAESGVCDVQVGGATVQLFADTSAQTPLQTASAQALSVTGTAVVFPDVRARVVRVNLSGVTGRLSGAAVASIAEVEVIARGEQ